MKYDDLLDVTNRHLKQKGKEEIKSSSTIRLLSKPRNTRSKQAKFHGGHGLFCTRKPPKDDKEDNENTHHQRSQVKLLKEDLFSISKDMSANYLIISMDDKAHLKPATDVGAKGARNQVILQPSDVSRSRVLPQHDFSESKLHITPGSFRFMTKKMMKPVIVYSGTMTKVLL
jgi:hypothetical protein